jgi:hypothetical protein
MQQGHIQYENPVKWQHVVSNKPSLICLLFKSYCSSLKASRLANDDIHKLQCYVAPFVTHILWAYYLIR